jgi:hypothetical protein
MEGADLVNDTPIPTCFSAWYGARDFGNHIMHAQDRSRGSPRVPHRAPDVGGGGKLRHRE